MVDWLSMWKWRGNFVLITMACIRRNIQFKRFWSNAQWMWWHSAEVLKDMIRRSPCVCIGWPLKLCTDNRHKGNVRSCAHHEIKMCSDKRSEFRLVDRVIREAFQVDKWLVGWAVDRFGRVQSEFLHAFNDLVHLGKKEIAISIQFDRDANISVNLVIAQNGKFWLQKFNHSLNSLQRSWNKEIIHKYKNDDPDIWFKCIPVNTWIIIVLN